MILKYIICIIALAWGMILPCHAYCDDVYDMEDAVRYCDQKALAGIEGIWEFPDDDTVVFIGKDDNKEGRYNIILLESPDCRFEPGEKVGEMESSPDKYKYSLALRIEKSKDVLATTRSCVAILDKDGTSIQMKPLKIKISLRSMWFLPKFWRSLKISVDNPKAGLPVGLVKRYPESRQALPLYF